ncbi:Gfo/Idh/MocA family protein [Humibacter ginsenosidimutans]|uniref:Gfo/Idh/MocA family oxidoreductase n=1 Tax=Humibacter ginsenosidimutans TaxID=2599293 RepID=A0A5B8M6A6_9MICO|nr:Gfo/Idh/MocA family oxidoreductase [Humibacter ginsenosidimutans]QDZ15836.1 Gfo/Idh/MocA family oxidoreductase [Humibacter ginsenosidimutans]
MKIAVLSLAHTHALEYIAALQHHTSLELVATDPDAVDDGAESRGARLAAELGIDYLDSYEDVWAWHPDAVIVCAENVRHRALVLRAAELGIHVLCEKPLATSPDDAAAMLAAARHAGIVLMTALPVRFSTAYTQLRAIVRRGELGDIVSVNATNCGGIPTARAWFTDPVLSGGGAVTDHVVHAADLITDLLEESPEEVYAVANSIPGGREGGIETAGLISLRYPSGVIASVDCSWSRPAGSADVGDLVTLAVVGTKGAAEIMPFAGIIEGWNDRGALSYGYGISLDQRLIDTFVAAVAERATGTQPDGSAGLAGVTLIDGAYRSIATGEPTDLQAVPA